MNLKRIFTRRPRSSGPAQNNEPISPEVAPATTMAVGGTNVFTLPSSLGLAGDPRFESAFGEVSEAGPDGELSASPPPTRAVGVMGSAELRAFFSRGHFQSGRYHGGRYKTQQALELGKREIITDFQLLLSSLMDQRHAKRDRVQSEILKMQDFSAELAGRLRLTSEHLDRQIALLQEQFKLTEEGQGWVLTALNRYQLGFDRGVTDALDFDLLVA
ncbi:MAG: hypothetical protein JSS14_24410 [Proteobacteria bacterium]|nr:hypothetical protein [Pseudomonadota bacterium]